MTDFRRLAAIALALVMISAVTAQAQSVDDLKRMSLADLMKMPVTTVSREPQPAALVPAAISVLTADDIRRSGATSLPEALRLAAGVEVARIDSATWAIGVRGFADRLARSMLVMIDGRPVYSPLFAGTYWEVQEVMLEDVDRIEIVRGPGGTLWGANAVTGIINIITKPAGDTQGVLVTAAGGTIDRGRVGFRFGGSAGDAWKYRVYGKGYDRTAEFHANGDDFDGERLFQSGFRADRASKDGSRVTLQGDIYNAALGERQTISSLTAPFTTVTNVDAPLAGGSVLARWNRDTSPTSGFQVQTFYARTHRDERPVGEDRDTFEADFQHNVAGSARNSLIWGLAYRFTTGNITATAPSALLPARRSDSLYSAFAQDEVTLVSDRLKMTFGSKIEHNDYSGVEVQPSIRFLWTPMDKQTVWWSIARAVRTPSRVETDYTTASVVNPDVPIFVRLDPNPDFVSEKLVAYEVGYRLRPTSQLSMGISGFYNDHDDLLSTEILPAIVDPPDNPVRVIIPVTFANGIRGASYGTEIRADFRPASRWRLAGGYSYLKIQMSKQAGSLDGGQDARYEGSAPRHQALLRSFLDLPHRIEFDVTMRYVSALIFGSVPAYATTDLRLAWRPTSAFEIALVGRDLNHAHHLEWPSTPNIEVKRSGYVQLTWRK